MNCVIVCAAAVVWVQVYTGNEEEDEHVLYVNAAVTYSTILIKVFVMMEHALKTGARWLLKTDDDAYINVPQTVSVRTSILQALFSSSSLVDNCGTPLLGHAPVHMTRNRGQWHAGATRMHGSFPPVRKAKFETVQFALHNSRNDILSC